jgi:serine O-acetyltransferase
MAEPEAHLLLMDAGSSTLADAAPRRAGIAERLKQVRNAIARTFVAPMLLPYKVSGNQDAIRADVAFWLELEELDVPSPTLGLLHLCAFYKEFRNLFYYRCKQGGTLAKVVVALFKHLYKEPSWLAVRPRRLGAGFFIQHGVGSNINGESIGERCRVNQQVTIGFADGPRLPRIGNNVYIGAGARVLGDVTVGDNVIIGANAVVTKNVPPNCTVVGIPAYVVRRNGLKVREAL